MGREKRNPNDVALLMDVTGWCEHCHHHGRARLVAYYDHSISIRCESCGTSGAFIPDDAGYTDAASFPPFRDDEDQDDEGPRRHTPGRR